MNTAIKHIILFNGLGIFLAVASLSLLIWGITRKKSIPKQIFINAAAVFAALFIYEVLPGNSNDIDDSYYAGTYANNEYYFGDNPILGYGPSKKNIHVTSKKMLKHSGKIVYNVAYNIRNGVRYTPNTNKHSNKYAIFLGGSCMFGEGLDDNETTPYYYNKYAGNKYDVLNYGFHGYGTHQALAVVENFILKDKNILNAEKVNVFYLFIPQHIERAAGYTSWDQSGPRYEVVNGKLKHMGSFSQNRNILMRNQLGLDIERVWKASKLYRSFCEDISKKDVQRVNLIVKKMNDLLENKGMHFTVIIAKTPEKENEVVKSWREEFEQFLLKEGINYCHINDAIEDYENSGNKYIIKHDGHPNKKFDQLLGKYLANIKN